MSFLFNPDNDISYSNSNSIAYGRIVSVAGESIVLQRYELSDEEDDIDDDNAPSILLHFRKAVSTDHMEHCSIHQITGFIFIFQSSAHTSHPYNLEGMVNVFYIHSGIVPAPSIRFSSLLFQSIVSIQRAIYSIINKTSQFQLCSRTNKITIMSKVWVYIQSKLLGAQLFLHCFQNSLIFYSPVTTDRFP